MVTHRWLPEDFDIASVSARNRRAWAEQEAKRASQIGKYANGVPSAADAVASVRVTTDAAAQDHALRLPLDEAIAIAEHLRREAGKPPLRSGPQPSPSAPLRDADTAAPIPCLVGKTTKRNLAGVSSGHSPKYRNKPTNGYASIKEAKRAFQLKLMQEAGQIRNLREQVPFLLIPAQEGERACSYVADFVYEEFRGDPQSLLWGTVVEDCKGMRTDVYRLKRKLLKFVHGITIRET